MNYNELWQLLAQNYDEGEAKAIARMTYEMRFGLTMSDLCLGKDTQLSAHDQAQLQEIAQRLMQQEPIQYVLGQADFCGRTFIVNKHVLIPRPETEELCRWMPFPLPSPNGEKTTILDIGTGSGCIAITLAMEMPKAEVTAWDISDEALLIAQKNAKTLGAGVRFERQDILDSPPDACYDLIVSNPPYIQPKESDGMAKNVLDYEPHQALFTPDDQPVIFYQRIGDYAWLHLKQGGALYFELNPLTADEVSNYLQHLGFSEIEIRQDQFGKQRFLKATKI